MPAEDVSSSIPKFLPKSFLRLGFNRKAKSLLRYKIFISGPSRSDDVRMVITFLPFCTSGYELLYPSATTRTGFILFGTGVFVAVGVAVIVGVGV